MTFDHFPFLSLRTIRYVQSDFVFLFGYLVIYAIVTDSPSGSLGSEILSCLESGLPNSDVSPQKTGESLYKVHEIEISDIARMLFSYCSK